MPRKERDKVKPLAGGGSGNKFKVTRKQSNLPAVETGDAWNDGRIWQARIMKTLSARFNSENGDRAWAAYYRWFHGDQWSEEGGVRGDWELYSDTVSSIYTDNIVQAQASAYMPFLLSGEIRFKVKARKPQDVNAAELQTAILNYEWGERGMTEEVKKVIDDVVIIGHGICKTGYVVEVDEARRKDQGEIEYRDYIIQDAAYIERVSPFDFIFDLTAKDGTLKTARWCAERTYHPLSDLLANPKYDKDVLEHVRSGGDGTGLSMRSGFYLGEPIASDPLFGDGMTVQTPEDSLVAVWTIHDKKYAQIIVMLEGCPYPLSAEPHPYPYLKTNGWFPYVMISFLRAPQSVYPIGVARQLKDAQLQINRIRTQQIQNVRAQKNMYGYDINKVTKEAIQDFADMPPLSAIPVNGEGGIFAIPNPPMNRDALILEQSIIADSRNATGADALFQGQPLQDRVTAGEVGVRANLLRLKADDKISNVERGVVAIARQVLAHLKANRVQGDVVEVAGLLGTQWREYAIDEIQRECDVEVEYFSAPKYNPEVERQQKLQVLQIATQTAKVMAEMGSPEQINFVELVAWVLSSFEDKSIGRFFRPALNVPAELQERLAPPAGEGGEGGFSEFQQIPQTPGIENPAEGLSPEDLWMSLQGSVNN